MYIYIFLYIRMKNFGFCLQRQSSGNKNKISSKAVHPKGRNWLVCALIPPTKSLRGSCLELRLSLRTSCTLSLDDGCSKVEKGTCMSLTPLLIGYLCDVCSCMHHQGFVFFFLKPIFKFCHISVSAKQKGNIPKMMGLIVYMKANR